MGNIKILFIEDDVTVKLVSENRLKHLGYQTVFAANEKEALLLVKIENPQLIILDPQISNTEVYVLYANIRLITEVPIIILTALGNVSERVFGLDLGADDFLTKPFSPIELEARIRSVLRRTYKENLETFQEVKQKNLTFKVGSLTINRERKSIHKEGLTLGITPIEFSLLELLIINSGKPLSRMVILEKVWGYVPEREIDTRIVDVHISRLRAKLELDPANPELILTVRKIGYMFPLPN
jgi:OmpR family response regulator RpaB